MEESCQKQKDRRGNDGGMQENVACPALGGWLECGKSGQKPTRAETGKIIRAGMVS